MSTIALDMIALPADLDALTEQRKSSPAVTRRPVLRPRVLIVEDDEDVATALAIMLRSVYDVSVRETARDFLCSYEVERPDVLLVDYELPDMNGIRTLQTLRKYHGSYTPAVMVSAYATRQQASLSAGFEYFVTKPFQRLELVWALEAAMAKP
jgi:CheY-like chemotaxis protein